MINISYFLFNCENCTMAHLLCNIVGGFNVEIWPPHPLIEKIQALSSFWTFKSRQVKYIIRYGSNLNIENWPPFPVQTRAPRGSDRSPEYNEHFYYKLDYLAN